MRVRSFVPSASYVTLEDPTYTFSIEGTTGDHYDSSSFLVEDGTQIEDVAINIDLNAETDPFDITVSSGVCPTFTDTLDNAVCYGVTEVTESFGFERWKYDSSDIATPNIGTNFTFEYTYLGTPYSFRAILS